MSYLLILFINISLFFSIKFSLNIKKKNLITTPKVDLLSQKEYHSVNCTMYCI